MKVNRILSAFLALALILGMMSTGVFAAEVTTVTDEAGLREALVAGGEVALGADVAVNEMIVIPEGVMATLDLAGHNIASKYDESTEKHIYPIANRGTLTIKDTVGTGSISGRGVYNASTSSSDTVSANAKLTVDGAKIVGEDYNGGACIWSYGGEVYINNATFVGYTGCVSSKGYLEINGGTYTCYSGIDENGNQKTSPTYNIRAYNGLKITDGEFTSRHGVLYLGGGECIIEDGSYTIEFKAATTSNVVYISGSADVTIEDGEFTSDNSANIADSGTAVLVNGSDAALEINGGTYVGMNGMVSGNTNTVINAGSFSTVFDYNHYGSIESFVANGAEVTVGGVSYTKTESGLVKTPPKAEVSRLEAMTLKADEHQVWDGSLHAGTEDKPLEIVVNFKALETAEEVKYSPWKKWKVDFYLTLEDLSGDSITADNCYLAGNYGTFGWIVIPTDGLELEEGVTYPVVSAYDANITYKQICESVKDFTSAIHIDEAILYANPNMKVKLELKITNPEDENQQFVIGDPLIYNVGQLKGEPKAEVTRLEAMTLKADEHQVWDGSLHAGTEDKPLEIVVNFKALETAEEVKYSPWKKWKVDFYLTLEDLSGDSITADNCYLAGNYGTFGWIVIPTDGLELEEGVTYPVVSAYDANITYKQICESVKDFTSAIHIDEAILYANPNMKVKLELKITNPEDENQQFVIGDPLIYNVGQLKGEPKAEVTRLEALTLTQAEHDYMCWPNGDDTIDRPLEIVVNFKALETAEEVKYSPWKKWKVDFYLTLEDLSGDRITADNCYLAGNYGTFGWIVIPTDGLELEEGVTYPVVSAYDANITYKQICESVKDFTSAIHIDEAILYANPNMKVKLELKITNPEDENQQFVIGDPLIYNVGQLKGEPKAEVTRLEALTLTQAEHDYMCWPNGDDTIDRPLEIVVNFKALETAEEVKYSPWKKWKVDFYLTLEDLSGDSITADNCYLAGNYGTFGWIVIPTDGLELEEGVTYPIVSAYDANITYKQICETVKDFTSAIHIDEAILDANKDIKVKLELKITNPEDENQKFVIGDPLIYTFDDLKNEEENLFDFYTTTVTLGNSLAINFYVENKHLVENDYYAVIKHHDANGNVKEIKIPQSQWKTKNTNYSAIQYDGLAAKQMSDTLFVTIYNADGKQVSVRREDGIRAYALRGLAKSTDAEVLTALMDMLNYGAAAQEAFKYNTENPANADTENYQKYASTTYNVENKQVKDDKLYTTTLSLENSIQLTGYFTGITSDMSAKIEFTDHYGSTSYSIDVPFSEFIKGNTAGTIYGVRVDELVIADAAQDVTITVYNADGTEYSKLVDSMNSYLARAMAQVDDAIYEMTAKFTASAYNTLH